MFRRNSKKQQPEKPVEKPVEKPPAEKKIEKPPERKVEKAPDPPPAPVPVYKKPVVHGSRIILAYRDAHEFAFERKILWNDILPELQQIAFHVGADLEWIDPLTDKDTFTTQHAEQIINILDRGDTDWLICLLGDCYGEVGPPTEIRKAEFNSIRQAIFEQNADVKLLDQNYAINRTREHEEYRLVNPNIDSKTKAKLVKIIQKGAKAAFDEGVINQINENRQARFFQSPIHFVVNKALSMGTRVLFVLRLFANAQMDKGNNAKYMEKTEEAKKSIRDLKNLVSARTDQKMVFSHSLTLDSCDVENFFNTKESDRYKNNLTRQITERMKSQLLETYLIIPTEVQKSLYTLANEENVMHITYARDRLRMYPWLARTNYDKMISQMLEAKEGGVFLIQGAELSGKTQFLCRLYEKAPDKAYKIIRFSTLTYSSIFAHELWHHIVSTLCAISQQTLSGIQKSFFLNSTINVFENLLKKLDKPLYLFIDDIHLCRFGHFLSAINQRLQKAPNSLYLFVTAQNSIPMNPIFLVQQTFNLDPITSDNIMEILKLNLTTMNRKLSSEQLSLIKHQMSGNNINVALGQSLLDEMLDEGSENLSGGIDDRLDRLEKRLGVGAVQAICRYLVASLNGLTSLELFDILSSNRELMESLRNGFSFDPLLLDRILQSFGSLLQKVNLDNRVVYQISHYSIVANFRHRYLRSVGLIKESHNQIAEVFAEIVQDQELSPRSILPYHIFPQATKRDNGTFNTRKLRNLWYHLLHTGNMDALKDWTLCQFEYLDAVCCSCGILHLLTLYEECAMQVLHHDIQVLCEQVLLPALPTIVRDPDQLTAEVIGRLRYTRAENSHFLNTLVEKSMTFVDTFQRKPLLVPLSCWIPPPIMKSCRSFTLKDWKVGHTILAPTHNHQHVLISGNLSAPGVIYMYHIPSQLLVNSFTGHTATVTSLTTSNSGSFFVSTSEDCSTKIWIFATGECSETFTLHKKKVMCSLLSSDDRLLITGSADSSAKVYDLEAGKLIRNFTEHTGSVVSLQLTSNDEYLITGSGDFVVHIWSIIKGTVVGRLGGLMAPVSCVAITSNDSYITVGCEDETLRVYSTVSSTELHELMGHEGKVNALVAAQDDCQLFAGTKSRIYCYDIHNGQILDIMDCQQPSPVHTLKLTADNFFLISGCGPRVQVWNVHKRSYDSHDTSQDKEGFVTAIAMAPDEKAGACGTFNGVIAIWDLEICQCISTVIQVKGIPVSCLAFTLNSLYLLAGNTHGNIIIIEVTSGAVFRDMNIHENEVSCIHAIDGGRIFSCCREGRMFLWGLNDDDLESVTDNYMDGIYPPIFVQPTGKTVIAYSAKHSKEMKIWTYLDAGYQQKNKIYHNEEITCFAATAQGILVATGSADYSLKLWQIESGYLTQVLVGHEDVVTCIALDEDEKIVVSGAKDQKLIIWSVTTGEFIHVIHTSSPLTTVVLTQDASVIFIGMEDSWIEAWSSEMGTILSSFNAHKPVRQLIRSFDGTRILAQLTGCAQLPILCLHNTPAVRAELKQRRRSARATSVTSLASASSDHKKDSTAGNTNTLQPGGNGVTRLPPPRSTFDKLERTKSRASVIEKDRTTTLTNSTAPPPQKSGLCSIL